jgi:hypothetical protein
LYRSCQSQCFLYATLAREAVLPMHSVVYPTGVITLNSMV